MNFMLQRNINVLYIHGRNLENTMIKNTFRNIWNFVVTVVGSIVEGRRLRTAMVMHARHGVSFDKDGNVVIDRGHQ
jgi:hypothetical protein